ncbi:MAG: glycosyltransferase family 4 protein [Planctomycetota bacterium]
MRITCITAGCGGMYCGAYARDAVLARALAARGCDVQVIPLYMPMVLDEGDPPGTTRLFFGGVNVWLQQHVSLWRHVPRFARRLLDGRPLLNYVARFAVQTKPEGLGPMTVSMLRGERGRQAAELESLLDFMEQRPRPDVVNLGNSLLSGIVPALERRLGVRVLCELQGEDDFVAATPEPYRSQARDLIRHNLRDIDLLIAPSHAYAAKAAEFLDVPRERIEVVRTGIEVDKHPPAPARPREPFTVGCLSRITPGKGLDLLVEACRILVGEQLRSLRLLVGGQVVDKGLWRSVRATLRRAGLERVVEHCEVRTLADKVALLQRCHVFSVPSRTAEIHGTAVMEAMAAGVPAVVPDSGVFPEMIELTGGGVLFPAGDPQALADELARLMDEPERAAAMGLAARAGIGEHYSAAGMAEKTLALYADLIEGRKPR